ncbi:MAG: peptidylprolyl isomerase [Gammaproteobacteria bacterium]|nr:peptidylprolyl isomerase [Gammaproteobacteria bacterium]
MNNVRRPLKFSACVLLWLPFAQAQAQADSLPEGIVADVNGKPITQLALDTVMEQQQSAGASASAEDILNELINLELLTQEAEKAELDRNPAVATSLQLQYAQTMANAFLAEMSHEIEVSDEDIKKEYDRQTENLANSEYNARHILVDEETLGQELIDKLGDGADFAELAKEYSTGPTGANGGELGWFQGNTMVAEFTAGVENLEVGDVTSKPVQTQFGWHVIQLLDKRAAALPDFDSVKDGLRNVIIREKLNERIANIRSAADIKQ